MGGFTIIAGGASPERDNLEARQSAAMNAQGYSAPERIEFNHGLLFIYSKQATSASSIRVCGANGFVAVCGTFFYKARTGVEALEQLHKDFSVPDFREEHFDPLPAPVYGTYVCIVYKNDKLWLFTDRIGFYKVFVSDSRIISSSFLTTIACVKLLRPHPQAMFEYVFQGATYGDETVVEDVNLLSSDYALVIASNEVRKCRREPLAEAVVEDHTLDDHIDRIDQVLDSIFDDCVDAFDAKIDTALSGGYDSRLILAHLLERDVRPNVHVYGSKNDADVRVAKLIAKREGFRLEHVDKTQLGSGRARADLAEIVSRNFYKFDGLPPDGIFDNGSDLETRYDRARGGRLALNGGGGEIFRNFFYLPDRQFSALQVVWTFYSQFDYRAFRDGFDSGAYQQRMAEKIKQVLGDVDPNLTRAQVERVYPLFRCRYWMGKNNSVNNRFGLMHTPLVEPGLVQLSGTVPVYYKNSGRLVAGLISRASERLASYDSAYGYSIQDGPSSIARLKELATLYRPPWARRRIFWLKNSIRKREYERRRAITNDFDFLFPRGLTRMRQFFRCEYVREIGQFNRLRSLEYFFHCVEKF